jgi:hypothetical protein
MEVSGYCVLAGFGIGRIVKIGKLTMLGLADLQVGQFTN